MRVATFNPTTGLWLVALIATPAVAQSSPSTRGIPGRTPPAGSIACKFRQVMHFERPNGGQRAEVTESTRRYYWSAGRYRLDETARTGDDKGTVSTSAFQMERGLATIYHTSHSVQFDVGRTVGPRGISDSVYLWGAPLEGLVEADSVSTGAKGKSVRVRGVASAEGKRLLGKPGPPLTYVITATYLHPEDAVPAELQVVGSNGELVEETRATGFTRSGTLRFPQQISIRYPRIHGEQHYAVTEVKTGPDFNPGDLEPRVNEPTVVLDTRLNRNLAYTLPAGELVPDLAAAQRIHDRDTLVPRLQFLLAAGLFVGLLIFGIVWGMLSAKRGSKPVRREETGPSG